jgi:hypothetical protein
MTSKDAADEIERLLRLELKIRMLNLDGIDLPEQAPEIPPLPHNFDWIPK